MIKRGTQLERGLQLLWGGWAKYIGHGSMLVVLSGSNLTIKPTIEQYDLFNLCRRGEIDEHGGIQHIWYNLNRYDKGHCTVGKGQLHGNNGIHNVTLCSTFTT